MRVLLSERNFGGHRKIYMEWLSKVEGIEIFILAPENVGVDERHYFRCDSNSKRKSSKAYCHWIMQMRRLVKENGIDVVHILDGDSIMRYFGLGFGWINTKRIVITYHHFFHGYLRKMSYRMMCHGKFRTCVAHTASVCHSLKKCGVSEVIQCEYPAFSYKRIACKKPAECKRKFGLTGEIPVIGIIGGMSGYKNIIPFLETLQRCKTSFQLLMCGQVGDVSEVEIREAVYPYKENVKLILRSLTDEEYEDAIVACDIIYCLYGHEFNGASGPLTDGVCAKKMILSCKHGSLGEITSQNRLGFIAECDDREEVLSQTELALSRVNSFQYRGVALKYRNSLNPMHFQETYRKIYTGYYKSVK